MLGGMDTSEPKFPDLPGWRFGLTEVSQGAYRADGTHLDGRTVSRFGSDLPSLIEEVGKGAHNFPPRQ